MLDVWDIPFIRLWGHWHPTIYSIVCQKYLMEDITTRHKQVSGQLQVFNDNDQKHLTRSICGNRKIALIEISSVFSSISIRCIFSRTGQCSLVYRSRRSTWVPLLTLWYWSQCFVWECDIINWTLKDWQCVVWSAESKFQLFRLMVGYDIYSKKTIDPVVKKGTVQDSDGFIMLYIESAHLPKHIID